MHIQHEKSGARGSFYIADEQGRVAEMTYVDAAPGQIIIDHTEVSDKLKGQGAGKQLVSAAVQFAREHHLKIIPLCPFTKSVMDKTPEFNDVRA